MASSDSNRAKIRALEHSTEFQLFSKNIDVFDLTERRLMWMVRNSIDHNRLVKLRALLDSYRSGDVAIAWQRGEPKYVRVGRS